MDVSHFAQVIKANILRVMDECGVTQTELATRTGIARPNLSAMLHGDREIQTDTIQKVADALGVKVIDLVVEHEPAHV